jgi:hypothetical protein
MRRIQSVTRTTGIGHLAPKVDRQCRLPPITRPQVLGRRQFADPTAGLLRTFEVRRRHAK